MTQNVSVPVAKGEPVELRSTGARRPHYLPVAPFPEFLIDLEIGPKPV